MASFAKPRAAREAPGPSPCRLPPALTDACELVPPVVMARESLVSGSAIPCINFPLSGHVFPPHALFALALPPSFFLFKLNHQHCVVVLEMESISVSALQRGAHIRFGCDSKRT